MGKIRNSLRKIHQSVDHTSYIITPQVQAKLDIYRTSFYKFIQDMWSDVPGAGNYQDNWHVGGLADHLQAVSEGHIRKIVINLPPRCSKTVISNILWPAWVWLFWPKKKFIFTSYDETNAFQSSFIFSLFIKSDAYKSLYPSLDLLSISKSSIFNAEGGERRACSSFGAITGKGADVVVQDDPNNIKNVHFATARQQVTDTYRKVMPTRVENPTTAAFVTIQQRTHEQDLSAYILTNEKDQVVHLCMPMEYEENRRCKTVSILQPSRNVYKPTLWEDPRKEEGELLWKDRWTAEEVLRLKAAWGNDPYIIAGQLQQRPTPEGGGICKREWFQTYEGENLPVFDFIIQGWDTALTSKPTSCYSACVTLGVYRDETISNEDNQMKVMLLSVWRGRVEFPELRNRARRLYFNFYDILKFPRKDLERMSPDLVLIEAAQNGLSLLQELKKAQVPVLPFNPAKYGIGSGGNAKVRRFRTISHLIESGLIYIPKKYFKLFGNEFLHLISLFPNNESNDIVDAFTQCLFYINSREMIHNVNDKPLFNEDHIISPTMQRFY